MTNLGTGGAGTKLVLGVVLMIAVAFFIFTGVGGNLYNKIAGNAAQGTLQFGVTDQPNAIGDFSSLTVSVSKVSVHSANDILSITWLDFTPSVNEFDLVSLENGDIQTLLVTSLQTGNYTQVRLVVTGAMGMLKTGGTVEVTVPNGELKLVKSFQILENKATTFIFDLNVVPNGNSQYMLRPVAGKVTNE